MPVKTSKKQLLGIFIVLAIFNVVIGIMSLDIFSLVSFMGIFFQGLALVLVWLVAWATDKWDDWRGKNNFEAEKKRQGGSEH